jgi:hypothetical protein
MGFPMFEGAFCILVAVALFVPLAAWCFSSITIAPDEADRRAHQTLLPEQCLPEPAERAVYLIGLAVLPSMLLGLAIVCRSWEKRARFRLPLPAVYALELGVGFLLLGFCWVAAREADFFHVRRSVVVAYPSLALPLVCALFLALWTNLGEQRVLRSAFHLWALGLVGVLFVASLCNEGSSYVSHLHFTAVFNPVAQVHLGKALLLDCSSQYGLYAHFLQPIFSLFGLSVLKFTVMMGLLTAWSYLALWAFLSRATSNRLAALLGFFALVFASWLYVRTPEDGKAPFIDLYFQYYPIRFVFPAFLVLLTWKYLNRPARSWYWGTMVCLAAGVLWNLDAGLPTFLTWLAVLSFHELFGPVVRVNLAKAVRHWGWGILTLVGMISSYSVLFFLRYGEFPNYSRFILYQKLFYLSGFCMLPMKLPGTWMIVILVYLGGLAYAFFALTTGTETARAKMVFLLAILGLGLFAYYQGRSHIIVLTLVWWPCFVLLTLFLDGLLCRLREGSRRPLEWMSAVLVLALLGGFAGSVLADAPYLEGLLARQFPRRSDPAEATLDHEAAVLKSTNPPGEAMMIVSPRQPVLHLRSGIRSIASCSYMEMVLVEDYRNLCEALDRHPSAGIYWEKHFGDHISNRLRSYMLEHEYELITETSAGYIYRKGEFLLKDRSPPGWHAAFGNGSIRHGLEAATIELASPFTIEVILQPSSTQVAHAAILGNHPGQHNHEGFVLHRKHGNLYELVEGDGERWHTVLELQLAPDRWQYLVLVAEDNAVRAYVDGRLTAWGDTAGFEFRNSHLPLYVGNWSGGDRPFRGSIKEARILDHAVAEAEIVRQAGYLQAKLELLPRAADRLAHSAP